MMTHLGQEAFYGTENYQIAYEMCIIVSILQVCSAVPPVMT